MDTHRLNFKPKYDKIVELLLYLAHKRPNADHYQAVKFLYLADKEHLAKYGRPITFEQYNAWQYGPVASNAYKLLTDSDKMMKKFGISELPFRLEKLGTVIYIREALKQVNHDLFSKSDLETFDKILETYGAMSFGELYDITHNHFAYRNAWNNKQKNKGDAISYEDMIEESSDKQSFIEDIESVSEYM